MAYAGVTQILQVVESPPVPVTRLEPVRQPPLQVP